MDVDKGCLSTKLDSVGNYAFVAESQTVEYKARRDKRHRYAQISETAFCISSESGILFVPTTIVLQP